jgi:hypothetical protein
MGVRLRLAALVASLAVVAPAAAEAQPIIFGVTGGTSVEPYASQTRSKPGVLGFFVAWNSLGDYVFDAAERADVPIMLHVSTQDGYGTRERITPRGIARGKGDGYLRLIARRLDAYGRHSYVRLLAEMNQTNNGYSAFNRDGSPRSAAHSTAAFRAAWRRSALILRGGPVAAIDARLRKLHLPPVRGVATHAELPTPDLDLLWVPQTRGSPDIPANMPAAYWPGRRYVDWVGTDFYSRFPRFDWLDDFYSRFKRKPFVFGEWAMWGGDDPAFVTRLFAWARTHNRVKLMMYNQGGDAGGPFRLNRFPLALAVLRRLLG